MVTAKRKGRFDLLSISGAPDRDESREMLCMCTGRCLQGHGACDTLDGPSPQSAASYATKKVVHMSPQLFQAPRGTTDILPDQQKGWLAVHSTAEETANRFGYERIDTPLFEDARLFVRGVGEVTDIVEKETYTFEDRGGDLVTLRPEGTAPVCRAYLEHGMHNLSQPVRLYYFCPVFRYERPQAGRFRQHHQFGIEALGDGNARVDAEVIELGWQLLDGLGVEEKLLMLNSTGDPECRPAYIERLQAHYRPQVDRLCENCKRRLEENPLRVLDCKEASCQPVIEEAPHSIDYLCDACEEHWKALLASLDAIGLTFDIDHTLVRGFDYYTRTVFEIVPPDAGNTSTILGGGRYDGLIEELGGRPTPGVGFGMGIERVLANIKRGDAGFDDDAVKVIVVALGAESAAAGVGLSSKLRRNGVPAIMGPADRSLKSQMRYASSIRATHAVIIGADELAKGTATLRNLTESDQREVGLDELPRVLKARGRGD